MDNSIRLALPKPYRNLSSSIIMDKVYFSPKEILLNKLPSHRPVPFLFNPVQEATAFSLIGLTVHPFNMNFSCWDY